MLNKRVSLLLSSFFIFTLLSSTIIVGASPFLVQEALAPTSQSAGQTLYSVRILPPSTVTVQEKNSVDTQDIKFTVQVTRENEKGQFSAMLSTISDTPALNVLRSFSPSFIINMEEGQTAKNATITIAKPRADSLTQGTFKFQVKAVNTRPNDIADGTRSPTSALSNTAIVVVTQQTEKSQSLSTTTTEPSSGNDQRTAQNQDGSVPQQDQQQQQQQQSPNHPPIAKAGLNQQVNEGEVVILDASTSTDLDISSQAQRLSYVWEQSSTSSSSFDIIQPSSDSPKAKFKAPQVNQDTTFTIKLTIQDGNGGQASDSVNILVKNLVTQKQEQKQLPQQEQQSPQEQEQVTKDAVDTEKTKVLTSSNHPPTAQATVVSTEQNRQVSISLQGSDPDKEDKITFVIVSGPSHAMIAGFDKDAGILTYIPNPGFTGHDSLKFKVIDSNGAESNEAPVSISVTGAEIKTETQPPTEFTQPQRSLSGNDSATTSTSSTPILSRSNLTAEEIKQQRIDEIRAKIKETRGEKISNQYIVVLKSDTTSKEATEAVNDAKNRGVKLLGQYQKAIKGFTVNIPSALANREAALNAILNNSEVAYIEPDVKVRALAVQTLPTGVNRVDGDLSTAISGDGKGNAINADIAILDTGIDLTHPDLNLYKHVTYIPGTTTGNDDNGHGTQVAGIAAAKDNDFGVVGIAPGARLWAVKVLDSSGIGSLSSVLQGLDYVTQNANEIEVADMSFGCEDCNSPTLNTALTNANAAGVLIVAAAGNSARDASTFSPANHADVIAVSAIADSDGKCGSQGQSTTSGTDDSLAAFSNYGPAIDMAAPGVQIYSTSKNGGYSTSSGTSMAAPHVAGAAAIYMSDYPNALPSQVLKALQTKGSVASTICDGSGHGYFSGDKDGVGESLVYVKSLDYSTVSPPSSNNITNSTINNGTAPTTPTPTTPTPTNGTAIPVNGTIIAPTNGTVIGTNLTSVNATNPTTTNVTNATRTDNGTFTASNHNAAAGAAEYTFARKWGTPGPNDGQFSGANDIAIGPSGNLYVIEGSNTRVQKFSSDGNFLLKWGSDGTGNGQFPSSPGQARHIAVDSSENVYVSDIGTNRIQKFTSAGVFLTQWGSTGPNDGQFNNAEGLAVDSAGNVYVADKGNDRIQKFDSSGNFLAKWGVFGAGDGELYGPYDVAVDSSDNVYVTDVNNNRVQAFTSAGAFITKWGSSGSGEGQFVSPTSIAVDSSDNVYVTDTSIDRVQIFTSAGAFVTELGSTGSGNGNLAGPYGIAADQSGDTIYIADTNNNRVQAFTALSECGSPSPAPPNAFTASVYDFLTKWGSTGSGDGQFKGPLGIATDYSSKVYVGEGLFFPGNSRVQKFSDTGTFETKWGTEGSGAGEFNQARHVAVDQFCNVYVVDFGNSRVQKFSGDGIFMTKWAAGGPSGGGIGVDTTSGFVYVADFSNNRIQKFTYDGAFLSQWGTTGSADGQFQGPTDVTVDSTGKVYVTEVGSGNANPRVQKFDGTGNFISKWGGFGSANGQMNNPQGIGIDAADNIYVADTENGRIQKFSNTGTFIGTIGSLGSGDGKFAQGSPWDVSIDIASGRVYATDRVSDRIQVFEPDTTAPAVIATNPGTTEADVSITPCVCVTFSEQMTSSTIDLNTVTLQNAGTTLFINSQVSYDPVTKIASLNPSAPLAYSTVYTATVKGGPTGVKDLAGNPLASDYTWTFTTMSQPPSSSDPHPFEGRWGVQGAGNGQFESGFGQWPAGVDIDSAGNVYVVDAGSNGRIQKFKSDGTFITKWGTFGAGNGQFNAGIGIATDSLDNVYVTDVNNARVQKFTSSGVFITTWGTQGGANGQFEAPVGIAIDSADNVYVSDLVPGNNRVQKFDSDGNFILKWGGPGTGDGQFGSQNSLGLTVDSADNVYVADPGNNRVQKFDSDGNFILKWGGPGTGDGQFAGQNSLGLDVDSDDNVYLADHDNKRIQKFTNTGTFITKWGTPGTGDGQFEAPMDVAVNPTSGKIYVTDEVLYNVQVFSTQDITPPTVTSTSPAQGEIGVSITPCGCAIFSEAMSASTINTATVSLRQAGDSTPVTGQVSYDSASKTASFNPSAPLAYSTLYRVTVMGGANGVKDLTGNSLASDYTWSFTTMDPPPASSDPHPFIGKWGAAGAGSGQFNGPIFMDTDSVGNVYVADQGNSRIQKFKSDGTFITNLGTTGAGDGQFAEAIGVAVDSADNVYVVDTGNHRIQKFSSSGVFLTKWGSFGTADGEFDGPGGIAVDSTNNHVYVTDLNHNRVQKFDSAGGFLKKWGGPGTLDGEFDSPSGLDVDSGGNVYVADYFNNRIQKFDQNGAFLAKWGNSGPIDGDFSFPADVAVDSADNVYVADSGNSRVQKFDSAGGFITKWGTAGDGDGQFSEPLGLMINSAGIIYVSDFAGRIQVFASGPTTGAATIAITTVDNTSPLWGIDTINVDGTTTGSAAGDAVNVFWGDANFSETVAIGAGGTWSATHNYGPDATGSRNIVAMLSANGGSGPDKATSIPSVVTVQKHPTSLSISMKTPIVQDTTFTVSGVLTDTAYSPAQKITGQTISLTGLTPNIATATTKGIDITQPADAPLEVFSCATCLSDAGDATYGNKLLRLNVGGEITVPEKTFKLGMTFDESVANPQFELDVSLADSTTKHYTNPRYIDESFPVEVTKVKLSTVAGSAITGSIGIANIVTGDYHGYPEDEHTVDFEDLTVGQSYPTPLVINGGSYYAIGRAPSTGSEPQTVEAQFAGSTSYLQSVSGTVNYDLQERTAPLGTSGDTSATPTAYDGTAYNQPASYFGTGLTTNSLLCATTDPDSSGPVTIQDPDGTGPKTAINGDSDADGICDWWEVGTWVDSNGVTRGFSDRSFSATAANQAIMKCPQVASGAFVDVTGGTPRTLDCDSSAVTYNLCITDTFSNVWGGSAGQVICPRVGHKDLFVEMDYMTGHSPDAAAIKDVIMAFGNAPITGQRADAFGRTQGVTLHLVVNEPVTHVTQINVWTDGDADLNNDFAHIKEGTATSFTDGKFGTSSERQNAKVLNMKHYIYRYGIFAHTWGTSCGPSGMGETLGNDFIVSLGCGFGERDGTHAGTEGTRAEQAGTLMHELGHNLNLRHGGPATASYGSTNYDMNCKVNYLSVMNYMRQFPGMLPTGAGSPSTYDAAGANPVTKWEGVRVNTVGATNGDPLPAGSGTSTWPGTSLDFSRTAMANLIETGLNEVNGIRKSDNTAIIPAQKVVYGITPNTQANTGPNVNWNLAGGATDTAVNRDINNVGIEACGATAGQTQKGADDWSNIKFYMLHDPDAKDGAISPISQPARTPELTAAVVEHMKEEAPPQFAGVLPPPNQDGSTVMKLGSTIPIKLQLKDTENNLITNAKLTFTAQKLPNSVPTPPPGTFKYDTKNSQYVYSWKTPTGAANQGTWVIRVYENYGTLDQRLLQGPQPPTATGETVRLSLKP